MQVPLIETTVSDSIRVQPVSEQNSVQMEEHASVTADDNIVPEVQNLAVLLSNFVTPDKSKKRVTNKKKTQLKKK